MGNTIRGLCRFFMLALVVGASLVFAGMANAQATTSTITIHSRICLNGEPTTDIFTECHDSLPVITTTYSIDGGSAQALDAEGNLSFVDVSAGTHEIAQVDGVPLDFAHLRVFCSDVTTNDEVVEIAVNVQKFSVTAIAGDEIVCDVYTIPEDLSGMTPTPEVTPTATSTSGSTTLPNTGAGSEQNQNDNTLLFAISALALAGLGFAAYRLRQRES